MSNTDAIDAYAALLGIAVDNLGNGNATASLAVTDNHLNPHGTAHGALLYSVIGAALAAAANNTTHSGVVSAVHIDYLSPARAGDMLTATAAVAERLAREDLFAVRLTRTEGDGETIVARASGRATRRTKSGADRVHSALPPASP